MRPDNAASVAIDADVRVDRGAFHLDARLRVDHGETVAIMGPSAAGKSTLLHAIGGLTRPTSGTVRVGGRIVSGPAGEVPIGRRGVVLLGQDPRLFPHLSARDNIAFGRRARGASRAVARREADDWLVRVGLPDAGDRRPAALSGGQQQRVALARALATEPVALLLDEPLTALDQVTADGIRSLLAVHLSRAATIIVTHDAVDAAALADRLVILEDGRTVQEGAVREVLGSPATPFAASIAGLNRVIGVARGGAWHGDGVTLISADARGAASAAGVVGAAGAAGAVGMAGSAGVVGQVGLAGWDGQPLAAVFRPGAVRISPGDDARRSGASGSFGPGSWAARIVRLEQTPAGVRVHTAMPGMGPDGGQIVACDIPVDAVAVLGLAPGVEVALAVAPADVRFVAV